MPARVSTRSSSIVTANRLEPARQRHLQADGRHGLPRGLRPLFHAAEPGARRAHQPRAHQDDTTQQPDVNLNDTIPPRALALCRCRRAAQRLAPGLDVASSIPRSARNFLDDGQFGAAYVLTGFNYDRAYNVGIEFKANYQLDGLTSTATSPSPGSARPRSSQTSFCSGSMNIPISPIITSIRITPRRSPARPARHISGTGRASASI